MSLDVRIPCLVSLVHAQRTIADACIMISLNESAIGGQKRCFHASLSAASAVRSGRKSVLEMVAPIFKREVNQ
jgi:hypothetical protein